MAIQVGTAKEVAEQFFWNKSEVTTHLSKISIAEARITTYKHELNLKGKEYEKGFNPGEESLRLQREVLTFQGSES